MHVHTNIEALTLRSVASRWPVVQASRGPPRGKTCFETERHIGRESSRGRADRPPELRAIPHPPPGSSKQIRCLWVQISVGNPICRRGRSERRPLTSLVVGTSGNGIGGGRHLPLACDCIECLSLPSEVTGVGARHQERRREMDQAEVASVQ